MEDNKGVYYGDYLQLDKILDAQFPESEKENVEAHDEMLFIIVHQAYELWFKQILHELGSVTNIMGEPTINDNSPQMQMVVHRLERVVEILKLLVQQVNVIETMTPLDFLDFRDLLRPASGFQSFQFKIIEATLGLKLEHRYGKDFYLTHLRKNDIEKVAKIEKQRSVIELVNEWLERMPYFDDSHFWDEYKAGGKRIGQIHVFWEDFRNIYTKSLVEGEKENLKRFDQLFFNPEFTANRRLSNKANRSALFIMLYRDYPILQLPYRLLNLLLEIDEQMATWRYRHMNMVHRMIGTRVGTGGSSGKDYLKAALDRHYIFKEIAELTSFLIERRKLPSLPQKLERKFRFEH
ncbi:tryptophan 2,3-dioxygenase [Cytophagales bacterium RKSG123]|nr:tryptophan 2,3-dioxygenase [Xanthovirga aplysinae]